MIMTVHHQAPGAIDQARMHIYDVHLWASGMLFLDRISTRLRICIGRETMK